MTHSTHPPLRAETQHAVAVRERLRRQRQKTRARTQPAAGVQCVQAEAEREDHAALVTRLAREVRQLESATEQAAASEVVSTGCQALDSCLPQGGYVLGSVVEYLRARPASGASYLALAAAASALRATGGYMVIVDTQHSIYPPALAAQGIDLQRVVWVRPQSRADALWAVDQSLRTPAVSAVFAELPSIDDRSARRMQLAAEAGSGLALLVRSAAARQAPSWAEVQWLVQARSAKVGAPESGVPRHPASHSLRPSTPLSNHLATAPQSGPSMGRRLQLQLLRSRGGRAGATLEVAVHAVTGAIERVRNGHDKTVSMHLASQLANPESSSRRAATG